jgi:hypothetical protein
VASCWGRSNSLPVLVRPLGGPAVAEDRRAGRVAIQASGALEIFVLRGVFTTMAALRACVMFAPVVCRASTWRPGPRKGPPADSIPKPDY